MLHALLFTAYMKQLTQISTGLIMTCTQWCHWASVHVYSGVILYMQISAIWKRNFQLVHIYPSTNASGSTRNVQRLIASMRLTEQQIDFFRVYLRASRPTRLRRNTGRHLKLLGSKTFWQQLSGHLVGSRSSPGLLQFLRWYFNSTNLCSLQGQKIGNQLLIVLT